MAIINKQNVNMLPVNPVEPEEMSCAPTVYTDLVVSSFTLMLEEPKEPRKKMVRSFQDTSVSTNLTAKANRRVIKEVKTNEACLGQALNLLIDLCFSNS